MYELQHEWWIII